MKLHGIVIVLAAMLAPGWWYLELAGRHETGPLLGQYLGVAAIVGMSLIQLLATRMRWLEPLLGGMDRIYVLHKWLGIGVVIGALLHDTIGAEVEGAGIVRGLGLGALGRLLGEDGEDLGEDLGELALDGFLVLTAITLITAIPYRWWYWTHRLMGVVFLVAVAHFLMVEKPFGLTDPAGLYVLGFATLGVLSYLYCLLPVGRAMGRHGYTVSAVEPAGDAMAVTLAPRRRGLRHRAGQFAFVSFALPGLGETHPFTISSPPRPDRSLRLTIKPLGAYTRDLVRRLRPGAGVRVEGPYGRFLRRQGGKATAEVWIAGGIGVTPFVAWAGALGPDEPPIHLLCAVRGSKSVAHLDELEAVAASNPSFHLRVIDSRREARLTVEAVMALVAAPYGSVHVHFCGPAGMGEALRRGLIERGLPARNFHTEAFEIRTGLGIERLVGRLLGRGRKPEAGAAQPTTARMPR